MTVWSLPLDPMLGNGQFFVCWRRSTFAEEEGGRGPIIPVPVFAWRPKVWRA